MSRQQPRTSVGGLLLAWGAVILSLALLLPTGGAVMADFGSFRSCNANSAGLFIENCGKHSFNSGDYLIAGLFIGTVFVVLSLLTHAIRLSRRRT